MTQPDLPVASILPVESGVQRPLWSVMIPTHHCARYLGATLRSVLAQAPGPDEMQIQVVDDFSTEDDPGAVVLEVGGGRVEFFRHPRNVGQIPNFNSCIARARGHLVHMLHGDDMVRTGFYEVMGSAFREAPEIGAAVCRFLVMNEDGHWTGVARLEEPRAGIIPDWLERIASKQRVATPSVVVRRVAYERVGGFDSRLHYCEDWEMWVRIASRYPVWYEPDPLAVYRVHSVSVSGRALRSGENGRNLRRAVQINRDHLPPERASAISRNAMRQIAGSLVRRAWEFSNAGERSAAWAQLREAARFSRSPSVLIPAAGVAAFTALRSVTGPEAGEQRPPSTDGET